MTPSPGATSSSDANKAMALVGWDIIRKALSRLTASSATQILCENLSPETEFESAQRLLDETAEMVSLLESTETFPISGFEDLGFLIEDAEQRLLVQPQQCLALINFLRLINSVKRYLEKNSTITYLKKYSSEISSLSPLSKELERCIDKDGEIKENASPELKQAIRESQTSRQNLENTVKKLLANTSYRDVLQDTYFTEREGRVVLPVRTEGRSKIEGIVHDSSGSGATLFMEPTKIIPLNNQLKISLIKVEQEKNKILGDLAREILSCKIELSANMEIMTTLDLIHAKAQLAGRMEALPFRLTKNEGICLRNARNPELVISGQNVVANDIEWNETIRAIIISGPNTGGKTVTLKTVGLMALMARAGLFLPVKSDSQISFFPEVYADIGDDQSIEQNLSTYSAHLTKIIHILRNAPAGSLILLDELGISTDPHEGAALAESILFELNRNGMTTLVSTHYMALKTLAQTHPGFLNMCAEFDIDTLSPTYRLITGVPGSSAALDIAEKIGLPLNIIQNAREIYNLKDNRAENLLEDLNRQKLELEKAKDSMSAQKLETENLLHEQRTTTNRLRIEEREFNKTKAKRLQVHVKEAKGKIHKMVEDIRGLKDVGKIRQAEKKVTSIGRIPLSALSNQEEGWDITADKLKSGDMVMVNEYGAKGILLEDPAGKKKAMVQLGNLSTIVETKRLRGNSRFKITTEPAKKIQVTVEQKQEPSPELTCDLRGMRFEEAQNYLDSFISQTLISTSPKVTIIHGHGTGVIKKMVREYCATANIGKSFAPGSQQEGGDGVTIIYFE
ncbi:MAG: endonuclease MutS2 [Nitrospinales bacterium]